MLEVKDLNKEFNIHQQGRKIDGLNGVSLSLKAGEVFGLTGQSGSGKSSLVKCIYRTYLPTSGKIIFRSLLKGTVDLASLMEPEVLALRKTEMGYTSQFLQAVPRVPVVDVVAEPLMLKGILPDAAREEAEELLERLLLPRKLFDAYPSTFSGGEKQRVNLARSLIAKFRLLLLDEPTASLDPQSKDVVSQILKEESRRGAAMLCVSHDLPFLKSLADCIGIMKRGRIQEVLRQ